jgi:hypothetical protein
MRVLNYLCNYSCDKFARNHYSKRSQIFMQVLKPIHTWQLRSDMKDSGKLQLKKDSGKQNTVLFFKKKTPPGDLLEPASSSYGCHVRVRSASRASYGRPLFLFFLSSTQKRKPPLRFRSAPLVSPPSLSLHAASARRPKSAHRPRQAPRLHGPPLQQVTLQTPSFSVFLFLDPSVLARLISAVRGYIFSSF